MSEKQKLRRVSTIPLLHVNDRHDRTIISHCVDVIPSQGGHTNHFSKFSNQSSKQETFASQGNHGVSYIKVLTLLRNFLLNL